MQRRRMLGALAPLTFSAILSAQSTATLAGTVTDPSGAVLPGATVTARNLGTGAERQVVSDNVGQYVLPSLPPGDYSLNVTATGFSGYTVKSLTLQVDARVTQNVPLPLASSGETVQVESAAPLIESETITVGEVIDRRTVQEIPLNGRHFLDLTTLTPGGVTAPAAGSLTAPSRGLGANSFVTAGNREDANNFQINGVNLNDMVQNQITFQPSINTTSEFKINNQTFSAEYGRSSGAVVNVSTRSGTNAFHGEVFEYIRNEALDARNYFNPAGTRESPLKRSNFGGALGGPVRHDKTFFFLSYEALRQSQGITLNSLVPTLAQRAAVTSAVSRQLLALIPVANDPSGTRFVGTASGPVQIDQGTADVSQIFSPADTLHGFYAFQADVRTEPALQGNNVPGFGDHRNAHRQILTVNETHVFSARLVNEARLGFNRISIAFAPNVTTDPTTLGLGTGTTGPAGIPQISFADLGTNLGGPAGFPQGRFDTLGIVSDAATLLTGKHAIKFGGEFRRFVNVNFTQDTGSIGFNTVANFQRGVANSYSIQPTNINSRIFQNALGAFVQDSYKLSPLLLLELGFRFEWNGSPTEGANRFVVFDAPSSSLLRVGTGNLGRSPYRQNYNYEPRLGLSYDVFGKGKTVLRTAYGYMADQPETNVVGNLPSNPPFSTRVSYSSATAPIPLASLFSAAAAAGITVSAVQPTLHNAYTQTFNANVQQELPGGVVMSIGYYGSVGRHLRDLLNINQPNAAGVRPFQALAAASPVRPGANVRNVNIFQVSSNSSSNYNALWVTARKSFRTGLQFDFNYNLSKSLDLNSLGGQLLQDSTNPRTNYGPSDFDARHRIAVHALYALPFKGNRFVEGFQISGISQWQTGNPLNVVTTSTFTGSSGLLHPNLLQPVTYGKVRVTSASVRWITSPVCTQAATTAGCAFQIPTTGFGNLSRNALVGPGFADTDMSLEKNTRVRERLNLQLRVDAFDIFNHPSFGNPNTTVGGSSFGLISATRFPVSDLGSSRQLQIAGKLIF